MRVGQRARFGRFRPGTRSRGRRTCCPSPTPTGSPQDLEGSEVAAYMITDLVYDALRARNARICRKRRFGSENDAYRSARFWSRCRHLRTRADRLFRYFLTFWRVHLHGRRRSSENTADYRCLGHRVLVGLRARARRDRLRAVRGVISNAARAPTCARRAPSASACPSTNLETAWK